jgi:glycosyltransferase involved in cell wall biosynthesis
VNVLWLSHVIPYPPRGGLLQRSYNLLREVARVNDVHLLAFRQRALHPTPESVEEAVAHLKGLCRSVAVIDIPWERRRLGWPALVLYSLFTLRPYAANWMRSRQMARRLQELLGRESIDLAHFDTLGLAEYAALTGDIPRVLNHHNIESDMMLKRVASEGHLLKRRYFRFEGEKLRLYERRHCPLFTRNLTVSRLDAERLQNLVPGVEALDIPNGVDVDYFRPSGLPLRRNHLVFAGSLGWYPNVKAMEFFCQEVWPLLKRELPELTMLIAGRNPSADLIQRCRALDGVTVKGNVPDIRPCIEEAQVYVCPIRDSGGTKLKVLDALALGKAMVAHPVAVEGIEVTPECDVLLAETPEEFVGQIRRVLNDDALRERLERGGRALVEERYSFRLIGERLNALYAQVAGAAS